MERRNCWEMMKCGRQPKAEGVGKLGVCSASLPNKYDGVNAGKHGGRFCWAIAGTLCRGAEQGTFSSKIVDCLQCEFLLQVEQDEGKNFILTPEKAVNMRESKEQREL